MTGKIFNTLFLILISIFLISCTPKMTLTKPEPIKFDKTPAYEVKSKLDSITKPDMIKPVYIKLDSNNNMTILPDSTGATHILLSPPEYAKVGAVVKLTATYKQVILDQEILTNTYIDQINSLKELVALEREKSIMYHELYANYFNMYYAEKSDHFYDNLINKSLIGVLGAGMILLIAI